MQKKIRVAQRALLTVALACGLAFGLTNTIGAKPKKTKPAKSATPSPSPAVGQSTATDSMATAAKAENKGQFDEKLWSGMKWREIGPFRGGRAIAIEGVPGEPNTYYFGASLAVSGKPPMAAPTGSRSSTSSIPLRRSARSRSRRAITTRSTPARAKSALRGNITYGDGVYKSVDGGRNWRNVGLKDSRHIGALIVHPENPDIVFVAAVGHAYGPNDGARNFSHDRWRQDLDESPGQGREHRRDRCRFRPAQSEHSFRRALAGAPAAVVFLQRRRRERALSLDRRRQHLATFARDTVCRKAFSGASA